MLHVGFIEAVVAQLVVDNLIRREIGDADILVPLCHSVDQLSCSKEQGGFR